MKLLLRSLAIAYGAYLGIALLIVTPLLNLLPARFVEKEYGRRLETEWVILNPFRLSLDLAGATLYDTDGEPFVTLGESSVNLALDGLWQPGWVLDALRVDGLTVRAVQEDAGRFNFSDLLPPPGPDAEASGPAPAITVREIALRAPRIALEDRAREQPWQGALLDLRLDASGVSTAATAAAPFTLSLSSEDGGSLGGDGELSLADSRAQGRLQLDALDLNGLWRAARPWLAFDLPAGELNLQVDYRLDWADTFKWRVGDGELALSGLEIQPRDRDALPDTAIALQRLAVSGIEADGDTEQATIAAVAVDGLRVSGWNEGADVSLASLFTGAPVGVAADSAAPQPVPATAAEENGWRVGLGKLDLTGSAVNWRSPYTDPPQLSVTPLQLHVGALAWPLAGDTPFALELGVNDAAALTLEGSLALAEGNGDISYNLTGLPLPWFNPNLPDALKATITDGTLRVKGNVNLAAFAPTRVTLDGRIRKFAAHQLDVEETLTSCESLRVRALDVDLVEHTLALRQIEIDSYRGRLHIFEDGSVNAMRVWQEEVGEEAEAAAQTLAEGKPWTFSLPAISISDSEIDFMDQSLPIPFRTVIGDINGEVSGLDSAGEDSAGVDIKGSVDGYAPVKLAGSVSPFADPLALDLNLTFNGVDMALLSPYSGTYAGYAIDSGLLDLDLEYALQQGRLKGHNKIRMDKLKLGEKIESDKAIDAPLDLALAILTDRNGVIDVQLPVSGDVNNPDFDLGGLITKALVGALTKAVTAPFTLLAKLAGGEEDLQRLTFTTGSARVGKANAAKLGSLAEALVQRPRLKLVITGRVNAEADRERLQKNALNAELIAAGMPEEDVKSKSDAWVAAIEERFARQAPAGTDPDSVSVRDKRLVLAKAIPVSDEQLVELGQARAVAVKTWLVNEGGIAADRSVIARTNLADKEHRFSGVELDVDS